MGLSARTMHTENGLHFTVETPETVFKGEKNDAYRHSNRKLQIVSTPTLPHEQSS
jgi:hypothetical protein